MTESNKLTVNCPDCQAEIVIDVSTGKILMHKAAEEPLAGGKDFDSLLADLDKSKQKADELFSREFSALKDKDRLLEEKFQEALKRAEDEPDEKPVRPWHLD